MNLVSFTIILILYFNFNSFVICFDPLTIGSAAVSLGSYMYHKVICNYKECCTEKEIPGDFNKLEALLKSKVYGQHIAQEIIINSLRAHWNKNNNSPKALTLSFHGWPGGGKNYITNFIKEALYALGGASDHVHHFMGRIHFPEESKVSDYQSDLYDWIRTNVTKCPKQLFIFDEVNKMPPSVLDIIKPLIDYNINIAKVDYRQAIFIFLSNTGESLITEETIRLQRAGVERRDIQLGDFESLIIKGAFNEEGGFHHSDTIKSNLIDHYVPFLPLEREHVQECIIDQFRIRNVNYPKVEHIQMVLDFVEWGPSPENLYSKTGCKRISQKVAMLVQKHYSSYN
ncbi:hypothetical protein RN001_005072 [Aquatica leii]|uniref:Torsin n=1 Tax=Aquatica leii TaxID=1421715 RepID=A0AAN7PCC7_9COLE|nr:hypothetical protein RN001_005072 [Aquatica leii]